MSFRSMRLTPPTGIMDVADPLERNASWQGGERLCRHRRTWHWLGVSWRHADHASLRPDRSPASENAVGPDRSSSLAFPQYPRIMRVACGSPTKEAT
jgi:hypothetical protein